MIQIKYQGDEKIATVNLYGLKTDFDEVKTKNREKVQEYISRVLDIVYKIRVLGETLVEQEVVFKIMRTLTPYCCYVVSSILKGNDIKTLTVEKLSGSLKSHEAILALSTTDEKVKALQAEATPSWAGENSNSGGRGKGRASFRGHFKGRGQGRSTDRAYLQCHICKKYGNVKAQCWYRESDTNVTEKEPVVEEQKQFMASGGGCVEVSWVWLINSGCSNHMSGIREHFHDLDENIQQVVRLGDGKTIKVEGVGTVKFQTNNGKIKYLKEVQFVPQLAHNLLSVGQLILTGYTVTLLNKECTIFDQEGDTVLVKVPMGTHRLFSLEVEDIGAAHVTRQQSSSTSLWHK
ncbi:uncharacterized protein LOC120254186 [Dioscorea cayenensis subsp. rotundata]|uniref:Uncharacterized protein LOC120254186 n=1 Tax=Dioscorea cayennensis subsp. rotundata TaxID=55577 RepID=A0AB40ATF6_DIOCR|nr:uncharacterized protein LOC120254186 [Dioscorea cayenensis subsp. rotundata]